MHIKLPLRPMKEGSHPWNYVNWTHVVRKVRRTQRRIYKLTNEDVLKGKEINRNKVIWLQKRLVNSLEAKLLAVRTVTTENKGHKTAGVDRIKVTTPQDKLDLALNLGLDGTASPIRRVWIPKPGKSEERPLGIPTVKDRAKQALAKMALEPEWEARFEPNSYGFRPGRRTHDAVEAIYICTAVNFPKYVLDADIKKCFDRIDHEALLKKIGTYPEMEEQIRAWLKAGIMEEYANTDTPLPEENPRGTPQGGVISPLLANIALHGLEYYLNEYIKNVLPNDKSTPAQMVKGLGVIRFADDFVIITKQQHVLELLKLETQKWLKNIGLELSEEKTKITKTTEGFDFLGFNFISINLGDRVKMKIGPSKKNQLGLLDKTRNIIQKNKSSSAFMLINQLKPIILGWGNYYKTVESKVVFSRMDYAIYQQLRAWAFRRAPKKSRTEIKAKYFPEGKTYKFYGSEHQDNWTLVGEYKSKKGQKATNYLPKLAWFSTREKHVKIQGRSSPYDGDHVYWAVRQMKHSGYSREVSILLNKQNGKCYYCGQELTILDTFEVDHSIPRSQGGSDKLENKKLLHKACHVQKTASDRQKYIDLPKLKIVTE